MVKNQIIEFNNLISEKYKINILEIKNKSYYRLLDISNNLSCSYISKKFIKDYTIYLKGIKYISLEGFVYIIKNTDNIIQYDITNFDDILGYEANDDLNKELLNLIKSNNRYIAYTIYNKKLYLKLTDTIKYFHYSTSENIIKKHFTDYLYKNDWKKTYFINMEGLKILEFIENNNIEQVEFLKEFNHNLKNNLFKDEIFKNIKKIIKNNTIYYFLRDLSNNIESFGSVSTVVSQYITEYKPFDDSEEYYINQDQVIEFIEKANTIKSINLCIKYHLNNKIVNNLNLEELIKEDVIIIPRGVKNKIRTFICGKNHILFCLQDICGILGYDIEDSVHKYTIHMKRFKDFITLKDFKTLLEKRLSNIEEINKGVIIYNIIYLNFKLNIEMSINNKNILDKIFDDDDIKCINNNKDYFSNILKLDKFSPNITKQIKFIKYNKKTYLFVVNVVDSIFENTRDKFGDRFKFIIIKNENHAYAQKVIEFESFIHYISRMKKVQAVKIREEFGIAEKYTPLLENATLPIIQSAFPNLKFERQYIVKYGKNNKIYYLDMAIVKYKIDIECDEDNHRTYDFSHEQQRSNFLKNNGWIQLRYNPQKPETIGKVIYDIMMILKNYDSLPLY